MPEFTIRVEGMDEMRRGLRNIDESLGKEMGKANKVIGTKVAAWSESERSKLAGRFGSYRSKIVKVKPSANQRQVQILVTPAAAEFGTARHPVFGRWQAQSGFKRPVWPMPNREGFLVGPVVTDREAEIADEYLDAVAALAHRVLGD